MADRPGRFAPPQEHTRRQAIVGAAGALTGLALGAGRTWAGAEGGISHVEDSIHQEPLFAASPARVYEVLTDARLFSSVIKLSGVLQAMHLPDVPAQISNKAGGPFALFGGFITGRQVELVPAVRVVQAWRARDWSPGVYSIAKFELVGQQSACKIVFDHTGFPKGDTEPGHWMEDPLLGAPR